MSSQRCCPSCDEPINAMAAVGPDEILASPCGCRIPESLS
jgi:hypothetical protein